MDKQTLIYSFEHILRYCGSQRALAISRCRNARTIESNLFIHILDACETLFLELRSSSCIGCMCKEQDIRLRSDCPFRARLPIQVIGACKIGKFMTAVKVAKLVAAILVLSYDRQCSGNLAVAHYQSAKIPSQCDLVELF